jgi:TonB-dependent starch-binding outer membrane protein SusC
MRLKLLFSFFFLLVGFAGFAQSRTITGKITDSKTNNPVSGVTVNAVGTTVSTATDENGNFSISIGAGVRSLRFSSVGYTTETRTIGSSSVINLSFNQEAADLNEVVVVGYGTQRKKDITGNVARISGNSVKDNPVQSFDQALSGRAAGVSVTMPNGVLNNPPVIRVRGISSISLSSFPLVVIDGIPTFVGGTSSATGNSNGQTAPNNILADLNPADIESYEILKDAAASAIYGSRASAGVLMITTKKGKQGRSKVNYDTWYGFTKPMNLIEVLNAQEYTDIKNEGLANAGTPANNTTRGFYTQTDANGKLVDTRWYDHVYQTGFSQNHTISISGANDKTSYFFSSGYTDQEGMLKTNTFKRITGRMNLDHKVNNWVSIGGNFSYSNSINKAPNAGSLNGQSFNTSGLGRAALWLAPNVSPYNADGSFNINTVANTVGQGNNKSALTGTNPAAVLAWNKFSSESDRILSNVHVAITPYKGLSFKSIFGIDYLNVLNKEFQTQLHGDGVNFGGLVANLNQRFKRENWQNLLSYDTKFKNHSIGILFGNEQQFSRSEGWGADRRQPTDLFFDEFQGGYLAVNPSNVNYPLSNFLGENYLTSFFGRINYNYNNKYYLSLNVRRDGFSAFGPEKKYGNFGGASAGWVLSEEAFYQKSKLPKILSFLKLRGSYGVVGNSNGLGDFAAYSLASTGLYGGQGGSFFSQAGNADLGWESSKKTDIGLEFGFLNNRITGELAYYYNDIDGLILADPQAPSRGVPMSTLTTLTSLIAITSGTITRNIGRMVNKGFEFSVNARILTGKKLQWTSSFNIATLNNKVKELATGNSDIFIATSGLERPSIVRVGESIGSFYAVRTGGVNPANGNRIFYYRDGRAVQYNLSNPVATRWTFLDGTAAPRPADQNADGVIIGPALPKWTGGWDNTFQYKNFDLNFLLFFSGGNYIYNGTKAGLRDNRNWNNAKEVLNRWSKPGQETNIPRVVFGDNLSNGSGIVISENVEKGDFAKIRNITLGYSLPRKMADRVKINSLRLYASVQNAFVFTNYTGFDPEVSVNGNSNGAPNVDRNSAPQARTFTFGLNIGF